jgi:hypothetical protein
MKLDGLSGKQIARLSHRDVFEWVRAGKWTRVDFDKWVEELMVQSYGEGFEEAMESTEEEDEE